MHKIQEPEKNVVSELTLPVMSSINTVDFTPGIEQTIISSKHFEGHINTEVVADILKVEKEVYNIEPSEKVKTFNFTNFLSHMKNQLIELWLAFFPSKKKGKFKSSKLDPKSKKSLEQFKHLASLYVMYCHTEEEIIAFEFAFDKIYYDLVTHSKNKGYDEDYFQEKMNHFISVFEV